MLVTFPRPQQSGLFISSKIFLALLAALFANNWVTVAFLSTTRRALQSLIITFSKCKACSFKFGMFSVQNQSNMPLASIIAVCPYFHCILQTIAFEAQVCILLIQRVQADIMKPLRGGYIFSIFTAPNEVRNPTPTLLLSSNWCFFLHSAFSFFFFKYCRVIQYFILLFLCIIKPKDGRKGSLRVKKGQPLYIELPTVTQLVKKREHVLV